VLESEEKLVLSLYACAGGAGGLGGRRACWCWRELWSWWCLCIAAPVLVGCVGVVHGADGVNRAVCSVALRRSRCWWAGVAASCCCGCIVDAVLVG